MSLSKRPRSLSDALREVRRSSAPATLLAAVQEAWQAAAGEAVAAEARPVAERRGVVTVACRSSTWAQELDLLSEQLMERLAAELARLGWEGDAEAGTGLAGLRFTADADRHGEG